MKASSSCHASSRLKAVQFAALLLGVSQAGLPAASYTVNVKPGLNLIANQLDAAGGNTIAKILPDGSGIGDFDVVFLWNCTNFNSSTYFFGIWDIDQPVPPGSAFFLQAQSAGVLTFNGTARAAGASPLPCGCGAENFVSSKTAVVATYDDIVGAAPVNGTRLKKWSATSAAWTTYRYSCGAWQPNAPSMAVGEGVVINVPCAPATGLSALVVGPSITAPNPPGIPRTYVVYVDNFGPGYSIPTTLKISGIPDAPLMTLAAPTGSTPVTGGFQVTVPAQSCGSVTAYSFSLTCGSIKPGATFTISGGFLSNYPSAFPPLGVTVVSSMDPNLKTGPAGIGPSHYLTDFTNSTALPYSISFENLSSATAPAQHVVITDQLDSTRMKFGTFRLGAITFGHEVVAPPSGLDSYSVTVPYDVDGNPSTTADQINVQIDAALDLNFMSPTYGKVTWNLQALDPNTGLPPTNPLIGFLPPNIVPPEGQGMVSFTVDSVPALATGDLITNQARIVFDANAPINTGVWTNKVVNVVPSLTIERQPGDQVRITWAGWTLEEAGTLHGPWTDSLVQVSPWTFTPAEPVRFYRLRAP